MSASMTTDMTIADAIMAYIEKMGSMTFAEVMTSLGAVLPEGHPGFELKGECSMSLPSNKSVVIWGCMSDALADAIIELKESKRLGFLPANYLAYLHDGHALNLPLAKNPRYKYKNPHWLPVSLVTYEKMMKGFK